MQGGALMARTATGQVVERDGARGITYALRFRAYGSREYVTLGCVADGWTRRKAEEELTNVLADVRRGIWQPDRPQRVEPPASVPTFHEFASEWFANHRLEVNDRTAANYEWALTHHLLPFFKDRRVDEITIADVDRYRTSKIREREAALVSRPLSNRTINDTISRLAQVLEVAVEYGYLPANPAKGRRHRCKAHSPRRAWLEPEQVAPLIAGAVRGMRGGKTMPDERTRALLATAICAGLRIGELLALQWRDVDLANGRIVVRGQ
jgi:integrase